MNISQLPDQRIGILCFQISASTGSHILTLEHLAQLSLSSIRNGLETFRYQIQTHSDSCNVETMNAFNITGESETNVFDSLSFLEQDSLFLYQLSKGYYCSSLIYQYLHANTESCIRFPSSYSSLPSNYMKNCSVCFDFVYLISNRSSSLNNLGQKYKHQPDEISNSKISFLCKRFYQKVQFNKYAKNYKPTLFSIYVEMGLLSEKKGTVYKKVLAWPENMDESQFKQVVIGSVKDISNNIDNVNKGEKNRKRTLDDGIDIITPLRILLQIPTFIQEQKSSTPGVMIAYAVNNPYTAMKKCIQKNNNLTTPSLMQEEKLSPPDETSSFESVNISQQDKDCEIIANHLNDVTNCSSKEVKESIINHPEFTEQSRSPQALKFTSSINNDKSKYHSCKLRSEKTICSLFSKSGSISQNISKMTGQKEIRPKEEFSENCELFNFSRCEKISRISARPNKPSSNHNVNSSISRNCSTQLDSTGIDLGVLAELPPRLRSEIRMEMLLSQRKQSLTKSPKNNRERSYGQKERSSPATDSTGIDLGVLYQLPPNIRSEIRISSLLSQRMKKNNGDTTKAKINFKDSVPNSPHSESELDKMNRLGIDLDVLSQLPQSIQSEIKKSSLVNNLYFQYESQVESMNDIDCHGIDFNVLSQLPPSIRSEVRASTTLNTKSEMDHMLPHEKKINLKQWFISDVDI